MNACDVSRPFPLHVSLPRPEPRPQPQPQPEPRPQPQPQPRRGILMADPDEALVAGYREPLLQRGFELITARSDWECMDRLRECVPRVLVLEPELPGGGGDGVLAVMSEDPQLAAVAVVVLASRRKPYVFNRMAGFPISDYQVKPLAPDRLATALDGFADHRRLSDASAEQNGRLEYLITRRTAGRVYSLRVETTDGRVVVRGRAHSYHVKQLALAAVLEAFQAAQSEPEEIQLDIEVCVDTVLLVTDGVQEARSPDGECFSIQRMLDTVRVHQNASSREVIERLYDAVRVYSQRETLADDLTAVVVKVT